MFFSYIVLSPSSDTTKCSISINSICFVIANLQSHYTQRVLVWKSTNQYFSELMRFFAGAIGMFVVNLVFLTLLVEILSYPTFESQVSLTLLLTCLNYLFQKHAVFKASQS